ncbi:hypothetical protein DTO271G3_646 [Paecilomyces variotii]|nr:hypothetical protein DTO271G3_646 [Paecilomyces variotii]
MTVMEPARSTKPAFLFTHPGTASNLLMQMLRTKPEIEAIEYPFTDTYYFGQEALTLRRTAQLQAAKEKLQDDPALPKTYQEAFDELNKSMKSAEIKGKCPFIKEHAFTLMKPESIAQNISRPRPSLATPHIAGVSGDQNGLTTKTENAFIDKEDSNPTHWYLNLFCGKAAVNAADLIVLNADEIIANPTIVERVCEKLQLGATGVRFKWDPVPASIIEGQSSYRQHFFSTIQTSCGPRFDKHSAAQGRQIDLDSMTAKWEGAYGPKTAATLRSFVDDAMPDYEYLCTRELRV